MAKKNISNEQITTNNKSEKNNTDATAEVLYQKMGNRWFAFSLIDDEVFVGSISQEEIAAAEAAKAQKVFKVTGRA